MVKRSPPEEVTLIRDLKEVKVGARQKLRDGRLGVFQKQQGHTGSEQRERTWKWRGFYRAL